MTFHESLRRSLAAQTGNAEMASLWRCVLPHSHGGAHQVRFCADHGELGWIHWDESGFHLGRADPPPAPARGRAALAPPLAADVVPQASMRAPEDARAFPAGDTAHRHGTGVADDHGADPGLPDAAAGPRHAWPKNPTEREALWSIAGSVQRLADVIAAAAAEQLTAALRPANPPDGSATAARDG